MIKRFFSIILMCFLLVSFPLTSKAEEGLTLECEIKPENYATIYLAQNATKDSDVGYHPSTRSLKAYYNTPYSENKNIYSEFGSIITSFDVPLKSELSSMKLTYNTGTNGFSKDNGYIHIFYDINKFYFDFNSGSYSDTSTEYETIKAYTNNYWADKYSKSSKNYTFSGTNQFKKAFSISSGSSESSVTGEIAATALEELKKSSDSYITFATGRETSSYNNFTFNFKTAEKTPLLSVSYLKSDIVSKINSSTKSDIKELITDLCKIGAFKNTSAGNDAYSLLVSFAKEYVNNEFLKKISNGGFSSFDEIVKLYDELVTEASAEGFLEIINKTTDRATLKLILDEMGEAGLFDENTFYNNDSYCSLNDDMKLFIAGELIGIYPDLSDFYNAYNKAFAKATEISTTIYPDNYAIVHITKEGYADHIKNSKTLGLFYNTLYTYQAYAEFGSIISGFEVPLNDAAENIGIDYYVVKGGMQSGRTIPVFYDLNRFELNYEAGYYKGGEEATSAYKEVIDYTKNYWPENNGYSYKAVPFKNQMVHEILETESGTKTYDVTNAVLGNLQNKENNFITFMTGRETSEYANGSFYANSKDNLPKLKMKYDAVKILDIINKTKKEDMKKLISELGKAGILEGSTKKYNAYLSLSDKKQASVSDKIFDSIPYTTFYAFSQSYDEAINASSYVVETKIGKIKISDDKTEYASAKEAGGKKVVFSAPITVSEDDGAVTAVFAEYENKKLVGLQTDYVSHIDSKLSFEHELSKNVTEVKMMLVNTLDGITPLCKAVSDHENTFDGKKVIFIGNSHVYRGMTVIEKPLNVLDQESRSNDTGYFYQLCKANGTDVEVTNWTFSSHGTYHIFGQECTVSGCSRVNHEDYLTDRYFDYVFINSSTRTTAGDIFIDSVDYIINFFKEVNPNVKFILLGNASTQGANEFDTPYTEVLKKYKDVAERGVIIADWGRAVKGIIDKDYIVEKADYVHNKKSFVVSDGYHSNALAGYVTTLTAYCAVTGEKAEGQPYYFYNDTSLNPKFDIDAYIEKYYSSGDTTNFDKIFESQNDMLGIQKIIDKVIEDKDYLNY